MFNLEILDYVVHVISLLMIRQGLRKSCCTKSIITYVNLITNQDYTHRDWKAYEIYSNIYTNPKKVISLLFFS